MAVDGLNVSAVVMACKAFIRGEVDGSNPDFAPSAPRLATEAKAVYERLAQKEFWDKTDFVEVDSPAWRALCQRRGGSMPQVDRNGKQGWYVPKSEIAALPLLTDETEGKAFAIPALGRIE